MLMINKDLLSEYERQEIDFLSENFDYESFNLKDLWKILDFVWDKIGCDNINLNETKIGQFYSHPVWIINGLFSEQDSESRQSRESIASWISAHNLKLILDYGGGTGSLAKIISDRNKDLNIHIYEPYPAQYAISTTFNYKTIKFVDSLDINYDCVVSLDVLEHVTDPLIHLFEIVNSIKQDGYLIIQNNFYPCIKCHLPDTFHLRWTFDSFATEMGLEKIDADCFNSPASIYRKSKFIDINWNKIRRLEKRSKLFFPLKEIKNRINILLNNRILWK
jgi:hypothetical protein